MAADDTEAWATLNNRELANALHASDEQTVLPEVRPRGRPRRRPGARQEGPQKPPPLYVPWRGCELCGQEARVCILEEYADGEPVLRRVCPRCARLASAPVRQSGVSQSRVRLSVMVGLVGLLLGVLGVFGDAVLPGYHAGFGWYQRAGVLVGALLVFVGMLVRAEVVALGGMFLFLGALGADWFGTRAPGIGWKQQAILGASAACLLVALIGRRTAIILLSRLKSRARRTPLRDPTNG